MQLNSPPQIQRPKTVFRDRPVIPWNPDTWSDDESSSSSSCCRLSYPESSASSSSEAKSREKPQFNAPQFRKNTSPKSSSSSTSSNNGLLSSRSFEDRDLKFNPPQYEPPILDTAAWPDNSSTTSDNFSDYNEPTTSPVKPELDPVFMGTGRGKFIAAASRERRSEPFSDKPNIQRDNHRLSEPITKTLGAEKKPKALIEWPWKNRPPKSIANQELSFIPGGKNIGSPSAKQINSKKEIQNYSNNNNNGNSNNRGRFSHKTQQNGYSRRSNNNKNGIFNRAKAPIRARNIVEDDDNWDIDEISAEQYEEIYNNSQPVVEITNEPQADNTVEENTKSCDCENENCDFMFNCSVWLKHHIEFNTTNEENPKFPLLKATQENINLLKIFPKNLLIHGTDIPKLKQVNCFREAIHNALAKSGWTKPMNMQGHIWPAIRRNSNVFIIAPPKSGKTISYIPPVCSSVIEMQDNEALLQYHGPLAFILCINIKKCIELESCLKLFLEDLKVKVFRAESDSTKSDCDVLITTPEDLIAGLRENLFTLKRVCNLILEDAHELIKNNFDNLKRVFEILDKIQLNRPNCVLIQTIVVSEKWSCDLEVLLKRLAGNILVCFADHLEAAHYGKIENIRKRIKPAHKLFTLKDVLKNYRCRKSVVFCAESEISTLSEQLMFEGVENIVLSEELMEDERSENEDTWCFLKSGQYQVLLCSDAVFELATKIKNADVIVHYSYPENMLQFIRRYRSLAANIYSPLEERKDNITHVFLIDETNENLPILKEFMGSLTRHIVTNFKL